MSTVVSTLEQGLIYAIMALGVYITYHMLDFPDLTVDGSFPVGAATAAMCALNGVHPLLALLAAMAAGTLCGLATGLIHVKLKVRALFSGIIMQTALYSVSMHIAAASAVSTRANVPFIDTRSVKYPTIFRNNALISALPEPLEGVSALLVALLAVILVKALLDLFLQTRAGYLVRAVGDNEVMVTALAKDSGRVKILGLSISNALVALSGAVMCQHQRTFDVSMGTGTVVIGLASVIIGMNVLGRLTFVKGTTAVIIGAILYKACVTAAISCGFSAGDMKLCMGVLFLAVLALGKARGRKKTHAVV